eukprot:CAMPEP_0197174650 /NCGR_PEP_ID=MMETSP1423-20130617/1072_1 /TAXON_ID=476441 /ORGANISM="Pseudo-nitzschia heimii, Strain UNC1101" /LENGTH=492 /DNA_ID=CAMNT_0042623593 /DNA_START=177 /DNA_END=1651 /DNA_ORIENTATION=-
MRTLLSLVIFSCFLAEFSSGMRPVSSTLVTRTQKSRSGRSLRPFACERLRGGATSDGGKKSKKRTKTSKGSANKTEQKKAIGDAMKEKDSAEALGDAIRDHAEILRHDSANDDPLLEAIEGSVASVGRALGASDFDVHTSDGGGVEAPPTSVIANYFLKSHGGAHLLQSASSFLSTACALGSLFMTSKCSSTNADNAVGNARWALVLLRRTMIFAMVKHVSGLLASASLAAKAIPKIGISQSRKWMEEIVREPVAQYVFYTALVLWWLPRNTFLSSTTQESVQSIAAIWWWPQRRFFVFSLVCPILLREIVSNMLVISDILVLWNVGTKNDNAILERFLQASQSIVDAAMSLLVSPTKWRSAGAAERQGILAGLVSAVSLFFETIVGGILVVDLLIGFMRVVFGALGARLAWHEILTKIIVVRLYVHYLIWIRRQKLSKLAIDLRGGATRFPLWMLDSIYDPLKAVGIPTSEDEGNVWKRNLSVGLGMENHS